MSDNMAQDTSELALFHDFVLHLKDRRQMIAESAYFKAEKRGFTPDRSLDDWLQAEREIDGALSQLWKHFSPAATMSGSRVRNR